MCMMWRSSKTGFGRQSRGGIVVPRPSSGEASGMRAATAPMHVVIGRADQEPPPSISSHAVFVRCAITDGAAMPSHMASDPLERLEHLRKLNSNRQWVNHELYRLMYKV